MALRRSRPQAGSAGEMWRFRTRTDAAFPLAGQIAGVSSTSAPESDARGREADAGSPEADAAGREALLRALDVPRNARVAGVVGVVTSLVVTLLFLGVHAGWQSREPLPYYVGLTFVVFVSTTLLAASVLTVRRAIALTVHPASLVRRGAGFGVLGGLAWLAAAAALGLLVAGGGVAPAGTARAVAADSTAATVAGLVLPWAPLLSLGAGWALYTRYKRVTPIRPVGMVAGLLAVGGAVVIADLAALDLSLLLAWPGPPRTDVPVLFVAGAGLYVAGHALLALLAVLAEPTARGVHFGVGPLLGLAGLLGFGPGPLGVAIFSGLVGVTTIAIGWSLRDVAEADVPAGEGL